MPNKVKNTQRQTHTPSPKQPRQVITEYKPEQSHHLIQSPRVATPKGDSKTAASPPGVNDHPSFNELVMPTTKTNELRIATVSRTHTSGKTLPIFDPIATYGKINNNAQKDPSIKPTQQATEEYPPIHLLNTCLQIAKSMKSAQNQNRCDPPLFEKDHIRLFNDAGIKGVKPTTQPSSVVGDITSEITNYHRSTKR